MAYAEYTLMDLDEAMKSMKRFQTREDWEIEKKAKSQRMFSYVWALTAFVVGRSATLSDEALLAKTEPYVLSEAVIPRGAWWRRGWFHKADIEMMKPQGLVARYYRWLLGVKRFPLRHGAATFAAGAVPAYITFVSLNHWAQNRRLNAYLRQETVFGAIARDLVKGKSLAEASSTALDRAYKQMQS
eukprot:NODE_4911_length_744_cov_44.047482_g4555_i0.p1 GENE.NODE_4911_length_744_cov_44.047482_g4555_i0~~NODE_4911_length_744_cov_44.047482_g4555_i0.p1  ORF type:complete len:186 (-),score=32.47 NODE_4911_length_744_cov_44.047482_g4555_i0:114-671(-)